MQPSAEPVIGPIEAAPARSAAAAHDDVATRDAHPADAEARVVRRVDRTSMFVVVAVSLCFVAVLGRVLQLQISPSAALAAHVNEHKTTRIEKAPRADITDRRGRVIAATRLGYRLFVDPSVLKEPYGATFAALAGVTGLEVGEIAQRVLPKVSESARRIGEGKAPIRYVSIGSVLSDAQVEAAQRLDIDGVHLETRSVRELPGGDAVASIVGKVSVDHQGMFGFESEREQQLAPSDGRLTFVRDVALRPLWVEPDGRVQPRPGTNAALSIDLVIQQIALEEIIRGVEEFNAQGGRAVMIDPATGEVLALVDYLRDVPGTIPYTPEAERAALERGDHPRYRIHKDDPGRRIHPALGRNRCVEDVYEPGSTFKPFLWASVVERGLARPDEMVDVHQGVWRTSYGRQVRDVTPKGMLSWAEVLLYSSNIGMVQVTERLTASQMRSDILRFGFGQKTNIGLPGESAGIVTSLKDWSKYTHTSVASGYEVAVTPLQLVRGFSVFARSGDLAGTLPTLSLSAVTSDDPANDLRERVLPPWVAYMTREVMQGVGNAMEMRARQAFKDDPPLLHPIFGKSGTAEIPKPGARGFLDNQHVSSFIAGCPSDQPSVVLLVTIDDPGPELVRTRRHYGSATAGPVLRRILRRTMDYMGVVPDESAAESSNGGDAGETRE